MAKKSRQPNLPQETLARARREMARQGEAVSPAPEAAATNATPVAAPRSKAPVRYNVDLRSEYTYVISDLQNMAILAVILMAVLVVLSFFL